jgi:hypothetical protein
LEAQSKSKKHFVVEVPLGRGALGGRFYVQEREREREREEYLLRLEFNWRLNLVGENQF